MKFLRNARLCYLNILSLVLSVSRSLSPYFFSFFLTLPYLSILFSLSLPPPLFPLFLFPPPLSPCFPSWLADDM